MVDRRYGRVVALLLLLGASGLVHPAALSGAAAVDVERLTLVGRVFVVPVDARRIIVAISTRMDGSSEHVFLYTASQPLSGTLHFQNLQAGVYYETGAGLRITPVDGEGQTLEFVANPSFETQAPEGTIVRFKQTLGLSHYLAKPRLQLYDLQALHKTADCERLPQTCVEVAGQTLPFPG